MSKHAVVEVSFGFLAQLINAAEVKAVEVDNMAGVIRLRAPSSTGGRDIPGVAPATAVRYHDFNEAFTVLRYPGQPPAFVWKTQV